MTISLTEFKAHCLEILRALPIARCAVKDRATVLLAFNAHFGSLAGPDLEIVVP